MAMQGDLKVKSDGKITFFIHLNEKAAAAADKLERKNAPPPLPKVCGLSLVGEMIHLIKKGDTIATWKDVNSGRPLLVRVEEVSLTTGLRVSFLKNYMEPLAESLGGIEDISKKLTVSLDCNFRFFWTKEDKEKFFYFDNLKSNEILPAKIKVFEKGNRRVAKEFLKRELPRSSRKKREKKLRSGAEARRHKEMFLW